MRILFLAFPLDQLLVSASTYDPDPDPDLILILIQLCFFFVFTIVCTRFSLKFFLTIVYDFSLLLRFCYTPIRFYANAFALLFSPPAA